VFGPGEEIRGGEGVEVGLLVVGGRDGGEDPVLVVEDADVRVGVPAGEEGVAGVGKVL